MDDKKIDLIKDIVAPGGGVVEVAYACKLTTAALYRWNSYGIPQRHWEKLERLTGLDMRVFYEFNRQVKMGRGRGG